MKYVESPRRTGGAAGARPAPRRVPAPRSYARSRLGRVALGRHQHPRQTRLQQDLLDETLLRFEGVDDRTSRRSVMSVAVSWYQPWSVVEQPQAVGELSELLEVPLGNPVAPRRGEVFDVSGHPLRGRRRGRSPVSFSQWWSVQSAKYSACALSLPWSSCGIVARAVRPQSRGSSRASTGADPAHRRRPDARGSCAPTS